MIRRKILGQDSRIRVGIVAADDDNRCKAMFLSRLGRRLELLRSLNLCSARTDDIKPACVAVCIDEGVIKFNAVVVNQSARAALEAEQDILPVRRLQRVIQTGDDIVSARCLAAGENDTNNLLFRRGCIGSLLEGNLLLSIGVREQASDLLLICNTLGGLSLPDADVRDSVSEHTRKLRLVFQSFFLKR